MPQPIALAATWDPEVGARYGRLVADEAPQLRNNVVLGPNADLPRDPWWGRDLGVGRGGPALRPG